MCSGGREAERKAIFDKVLPGMERAGWSVRVPLLRFWGGEKRKGALIRGLTNKNDIALVEHVFDTYFEPLLARVGAGWSATAEADAFFDENREWVTRVVQLTSAATYGNGTARFSGNSLEGERTTAVASHMPKFEDAGFMLTAKIISLWNEERDVGVLLHGLDDVSCALMQKLLRLLKLEEGCMLAAEEAGTSSEQVCSEFVSLKLQDEAQAVAYLARAQYAHTLAEQRERLVFLVDCIAADLPGFAQEAQQRELLQSVLESFWTGHVRGQELLTRQAGVERAFTERILHHVSTTEMATLKKACMESTLIRRLVLEEPAGHRFFKKNYCTFRRVAQLCSSECAEALEDERLFPGSIDCERSFILDEIVRPWKKHNWHVDAAFERMWRGERRLALVCQGIAASDYGSRFCLWRTWQLCREFGIIPALPQLPGLVDTLPPPSTTGTSGAAAGAAAGSNAPAVRPQDRADEGSGVPSAPAAAVAPPSLPQPLQPPPPSTQPRPSPPTGIPAVSLCEVDVAPLPMAHGSFKEVFRARLVTTIAEVGEANEQVAVIRLRQQGCTLAAELRVFAVLGRHPSLTRLKAVTYDDAGCLTSLITEFAELGSLDHVLVDCVERGEAAAADVLVTAALQVHVAQCCYFLCVVVGSCVRPTHGCALPWRT